MKIYLTKTGREYLAQALKGSTIALVRAECGTGRADDPENAAALSDYAADMVIASKRAEGENTVIQTQFTNVAETGETKYQDITITEMALFATLDNENAAVLAYAATDEGETGIYIPAVRTEIVMNWTLAVSSAADITIAPTSAAYVTQADFTAHTESQEAHTRVIAADTEPEGVNYLWFAPSDTETDSGGVSEVVLNATAYTDSEDKLHAEIYTVDNSEVEDGEVTIEN